MSSKWLTTVLLAVPLFAQFHAGIQGTLTDKSGAVVPSVPLKLTNTETSRTSQTETDANGAYRFLDLAPGIYRIDAQRKGFKTTSATVTVNAESVQTADLVLEPGEISSSVTVVSDVSPAVETTNGNITRAITSQEVTALPQVGRDPYELLRLTPGVFGDGARSSAGQAVHLPNESAGPGGSNASLFQTENQTPITANGQRVTTNNFMVDGVSVNSLQWGGAAVVTPNQESVGEIRVNANSYSAEYGRNSGAQINVISKNGTNQFHGSAVFLLQNPNFNAYNKPSLPAIPVSRVNNNFRNYGGSVGGPIRKNSLFFFFSTEGLRERSTTYQASYIETPQYDQSVLSSRPNSIAARVIGSAGNTPRIVSILPLSGCPASLLPNCRVVNGQLDLGSIGGTPGAYLPQDSAGGGLDGTPDLAYATIGLPQSFQGHQYNGRIDWSHGNEYVAGSTYATTLESIGADSAAGSRPNADQRITPLNEDITAIYTHTFSATLVNEARGNFTRFAYNQLQTSGLTNYGIPSLQIQFPGFPGIQYGADQGQSSPAAFAQNTYEFRDALSKVSGKHALKFGFELRREQDNDNLAGAARPVYAIQNLWNFANDAPVYESISANPATGGAPLTQAYYRTRVYAGYVQDDWKVRSNLTINLGLRWEYFAPMTEKNGNLYNWIPGPGFGNISNSSIRQVDRLYNPDKRDFAPRFGFAYGPSPNVVLRGGFAVMFNRVENVLFAELRQDAPTNLGFSLCCGTAGSPFAGGQIAYGLGSSNSIYSFPRSAALAVGINPVTNTPNVGPGNTISVYSVPQRFATPYAYIYSLEADVRLPHEYVITLGYQGSASHHLVQIMDLNFLYPSTGAGSVFGSIFNVQPSVNANYNALNATFSRHLSNGLQFQQNFRWAKSLDTNSYDGPGGDTNPTYPANLRTEYGPSDFDVKYSYTASALYELPFFKNGHGLLAKALGGWKINSVFTFHTGFPWTPKTTAQAVLTPGGATLSPVRPYQYLCGSAGGACALSGQSNSAFLRPGGNFPGGGSAYFSYLYPSGFTTLPPGIGRNVFRGPWYKDFDFSFDKLIRLPNRVLGEGTALDIRANMFNAFNQQNFAPFNFLDNSTLINLPQFGKPTAELAGRVIEMQARLSF